MFKSSDKVFGPGLKIRSSCVEIHSSKYVLVGVNSDLGSWGNITTN